MYNKGEINRESLFTFKIQAKKSPDNFTNFHKKKNLNSNLQRIWDFHWKFSIQNLRHPVRMEMEIHLGLWYGKVESFNFKKALKKVVTSIPCHVRGECRECMPS